MWCTSLTSLYQCAQFSPELNCCLQQSSHNSSLVGNTLTWFGPWSSIQRQDPKPGRASGPLFRPAGDIAAPLFPKGADPLKGAPHPQPTGIKLSLAIN